MQNWLDKIENIKNHKQNIPILFMMIGLPASGKSYVAEQIKDENTIVHSSDEIRKELFGDENSQENNQRVFDTLHKRIKGDLSAGKNVVFDATNVSKKRRISFLEYLNNISCYKVAVCVMTPYTNCILRNLQRGRVVPGEVMTKMYKLWTPPYYHEGFDDLIIVDNSTTKIHLTVNELFEGTDGLDSFNQHNEHHSLSLGKHCKTTATYNREKFPYSILLYYASLFHDIGKAYTQSKCNSKGIEDGNYHYYSHQNVGAYEALFYMPELHIGDSGALYISNLIYYHMHPYLSWAQSPKALARDRARLGEVMYNDILRLHQADVSAK